MNQPATAEQAARAHCAKCFTAIPHILLFLLLSSCLPAQTKLWSQVSTTYNPPKTAPVTLTRNETRSIRNLLRTPAQSACACGDDPEPDRDWVNDIFFSTISLARGHKTILVEAGPGCARGGQGSNGAMWIVEFHGSKPTLLATPAQNFSGWLYSTLHNSQSVYDDIVLGWHMSAAEAASLTSVSTAAPTNPSPTPR